MRHRSNNSMYRSAAAMLLAAPIALAAPARAAAPETSRSVPPSAGQQRLERAIGFMRTLETRRFGDRGYATRALEEADIIRNSPFYAGDVRGAVDLIRLLALMALDRAPEAARFVDTTIARGDATPDFFGLAIRLATIDMPSIALDLLDRADRQFTAPEARDAMRKAIDHDVVRAIDQPLESAKDRPSQARLAEVLLRLGWAADDPEQVDAFRLTALKRRLAIKDVAGARVLAGQITSPAAVVQLIVTKHYDALVGADRDARLAAAIRATDAATAARLSADPANAKAIRQRASFLRSVGREAEALALLTPVTASPARLEAAGDDGPWIVNDAAYSLAAQGRAGEGVALMRTLISVGLDKKPALVNQAINLSDVIDATGDHRAAARHSESLFRAKAPASDFGNRWMWSNVACGYALAGDLAAARPWVARLKVGADGNRAATMRALLCTNDLAAAADQMVERLAGEDGDGMLSAIQDYSIVGKESETDRILGARWRQLIAQPRVAAAIAANGYVLKLPLARTYWGGF